MSYNNLICVADDAVPVAYVIKASRRIRPFIKGPLPLDWFIRAADCSGTAVKVGLLLFYRHGLKRNPLTVSNELAARFSISRGAKRQALKALEKAGLVELQQIGQRVIVNCVTSNIRTTALGVGDSRNARLLAEIAEVVGLDHNTPPGGIVEASTDALQY